MEETTRDAVVNALLADFASQLENTSKSTSSKSRKKSESSEKSSRASDKPTKEPEFVPLAGNSTEKTTSADNRLSQFMEGKLALTLLDGTEHYYDPDEGRTYTLQEISDVMGVTRERVRQIEHSALKKMYAAFSAVARNEGINPIDWANQLFTEIDSRKGGEEHNVCFEG